MVIHDGRGRLVFGFVAGFAALTLLFFLKAYVVVDLFV